MPKLFAVLIASFALALSACGGDDSSDNSSSDSGSAATTPASSGGGSSAPAGKTVTVDIKNIQFAPKELTVKAGTTVKWTNSDQVAHTVTKDSGPGPDFDSGDVAGGGTYEQTFKTPGKIHYVCQIHPGQEGDIVVQ